MTTFENCNIPSDVRNNAANRAAQKGENMVVFTGDFLQGDKTVTRTLFTPLSLWKQSPKRDNVTFLAVVDREGNYVYDEKN